MLHSLVIAYRDRARHLQAFLDCLERCDEVERVEVVIVDLNSTDDTDAVVSRYRHLNIAHRRVNYSGRFWKTKALNYGVKRGRGEIVTIHDVDCLPPPSFLADIHQFFAAPTTTVRKLSRDVRLLDHLKTQRVWDGRYDDYARWLFDLTDLEAAATAYEGKLVGNSQFSMMRDLFIAVGGYDERFVGYGHEDWEFGLRTHRVFGDAVVRGNVWHLRHVREGDWEHETAGLANRRLFRIAAGYGFPPMPVSSEWGEFPVRIYP